MKIDMLKNYPEYIEKVTEWMNQEFGNEKSKNFYKGIVEHSLTENQIPITFVAVEDGELLGTVGIWRGDLLSRQELYPWLSALIVNPTYRNKGIGKQLQEYVIDYCRKKRFKEIYLYTELENYYEKTGWSVFDKGFEYSGDELTIYRYLLEL